jgi:hypothetical protein
MDDKIELRVDDDTLAALGRVRHDLRDMGFVGSASEAVRYSIKQADLRHRQHAGGGNP